MSIEEISRTGQRITYLYESGGKQMILTVNFNPKKQHVSAVDVLDPKKKRHYTDTAFVDEVLILGNAILKKGYPITKNQTIMTRKERETRQKVRRISIAIVVSIPIISGLVYLVFEIWI